MKITCPNCTTSYQVPDGSIGAAGRNVRCATCGETWHAEVEPGDAGDTAKPEVVLPEAEEQSQDDIDALFDSPSDAGEEQSQDDIDALFDSPSDAGEEQSQDDIDALFDSPSDAGEEQSQDDIDALFDSPSSGEEQNQDDIDALFDSPSDAGEEQSQDDVDAMFASGDAIDAPAQDRDDSPIEPIVVSADDANQMSGAQVVDMMNAASFEAQKVIAKGKDADSKASRRKRRRRKGKAKTGDALPNSNKEWAIGSLALVAALAIVIGLFVAPKFWVRTFPDLASFYSMLGMPVNVAGVDIDTVDVRLVQRAGSPVISVEAELVNPETDPVLLPAVQLSVLGKDDEELYSWAIEPEKAGLGPGEHKRIESSIAAPSNAKSISLRVFHP
ncbi:MJ0042 family finger-like domain-containing protein [Cohaesibacter sp. ES.047]|uniref:zinc-ribbon domain-containing protein n=1 Tax=Cohaesibacter sp. ES.047 TaxID=1798205 RepID=UPI000BB852F0|nr:zinc-ribbon domain-containing protein [Cohaesibacter sp. ES.047]SNY90807.1 MJ0042 family finger-like domain-containing protein [Cohaesibacter sp. ES.047]